MVLLRLCVFLLLKMESIHGLTERKASLRLNGIYLHWWQSWSWLSRDKCRSCHDFQSNHTAPFSWTGSYTSAQYISFIHGLNRYESLEAALRACNQWAESAGQYTVKRKGIWISYSQSPLRLCRKEGDSYVGSEIPLDGATVVGQELDDPEGVSLWQCPSIGGFWEALAVQMQ